MALRERIEHVLAHPTEAKEMGKQGREVVLKRFTWDAVARRCLDAYGEKPDGEKDRSLL
jgi:glycosyltransferase involved in cell wall biosynthesis